MPIELKDETVSLSENFGVTVQAWGANDTDIQGSGMHNYFNSELFGGHPGHAGLEIRVPFTAESKALIQKYCAPGMIPFSEEKKFDIANNRWSSNYLIRFSWGVSANGNLYFFQTREEERKNWVTAVNIKDKLTNGSMRAFRGRLGTRTTLVQDTARLTAELDLIEDLDEKELLGLFVEHEKIQKDIKDLTLLRSKLQATVEKQTGKMLSASEKLLIKNLLSNKIKEMVGENGRELYSKKELTAKELKYVYDMVLSQITESNNKSPLVNKKIQELIYRLYEKDQAKLTNIFSKYKAKLWLSLSSFIELELSEKIEALKRQLLTAGSIEKSVFLPLCEQGKDNGLDLENMLKEMHRLAVTQDYDLYKMNCCETIQRILAAGAPSKFLRNVASHRAWGFFSNPQQVYNTAQFMQQFMKSGYSWIDELTHNDFFMIDRLFGIVIKHYLAAQQADQDREDAKTPEQKTAEEKNKFHRFKVSFDKIKAISLGLFLAPLIAFLAIIRNLAQPTRFIKTSYDFMNYTYKTNSLLLEILFTVILVPAIAVHIVPVILENLVKTFIFTFTHLAKIPQSLSGRLKSPLISFKTKNSEIDNTTTKTSLDVSPVVENESTAIAVEITDTDNTTSPKIDTDISDDILTPVSATQRITNFGIAVTDTLGATAGLYTLGIAGAALIDAFGATTAGAIGAASIIGVSATVAFLRRRFADNNTVANSNQAASPIASVAPVTTEIPTVPTMETAPQAGLVETPKVAETAPTTLIATESLAVPKIDTAQALSQEQNRSIAHKPSVITRDSAAVDKTHAHASIGRPRKAVPLIFRATPQSKTRADRTPGDHTTRVPRRLHTRLRAKES